MTPVVLGKSQIREELKRTDRKTMALCGVSGIFLSLHFTAWFESCKQTSVASSTAIVCTEVIWVAMGFVVFLKGWLGKPPLASIAVTVFGSLLIALSDYSAGGDHLPGDGLALAAAVFSAVYTLIGRSTKGNFDNILHLYRLCLLCTGALCRYGRGRDSFLWVWAQFYVVGLLLAVFSNLLGHSIFSWCLKYLSPSFVSASKLCDW